MLSKLDDAIATVEALLADLDSRMCSAPDAARAVERFAKLERLAVAGRTLAGRRVERSKVWREEGFSTPARWMAAKTQTTLAAAVATIETGRRIEALTETRHALMSGSLSGVQAAEITLAATADPAAESNLLETARTETVSQLRERCRSVVAAMGRDLDAEERVHRSRYLRTWMDGDGAFRLDAKLTADAGARLKAIIDVRARVFRDRARRVGSPERAEAHAADALVSLSDDAAPQPRAVVHVHVDEKAWKRGRVEPGETCRVAGVGPVSVASARHLARDGRVAAVLAEGADVTAVAHFGRTIPARVRTALEARDISCVVPGCDETADLEIDHVLPLAEGGPTRLDNLARLCRWHHSLKTHRGWRLMGAPGRWNFFKPKRGPIRPPPDPGG
jgi:5-methylcytosine-specific restriction endonuclease McrA